jgi:RecA-family ATPase
LIAPGATGKSILTIIEAISIALGLDLLKLGHVEQGNVLLINNEDDYDELNRRFNGVCIEYKLDQKKLAKHLFYRSGYGNRVIIADEGITKNVEATNEVNQIIAFIKENNIRLVIVDPFISTHTSEENNNSKIDQVIQVYRRIAIETNVAIRIVHHTPKGNNNQNGGAGDVDMARGASSLKDGARVAHTLFPMSSDDAKQYGMDTSEQLRYVRLDDAKTNFTLKTGIAKWLYKKSVYLANGEEIGVLVPKELETKVVSKEEKAEKDKSRVIHQIGHAALNKLGEEGGIISSPDLLAEYMNISGYKRSQAKDNISLLPLGTVKKELIKPYGKAYRSYQSKGIGKTATRYVHIEPDY